MRDNTKRNRSWVHRWLLIVCSLILTVGVLQAAPTSVVSSTRALVLPEGRSTMLHFNRMKRVEVIAPDLVDVVVASLNDLSVYGKKAGETTLYVWDLLGIHQLDVTVTGDTAASHLIRDLKQVLGLKLTYTMIGDKTVVIEGAIGAADAERVHTVVNSVAKGDVQIVDLLKVEGTPASAATATADALHKALGDRLQYVVWNDNTVLVQGALGDQAQVDRAAKLITAAAGHGVNVVNLVEVNPSVGTAPVEAIAQAVGNRFRVWQIQGSTVGVEGSVTSQTELDDLNHILDTFNGQAKFVNLVRLNVPKPDINQTVALLQRVAGNAVSVRPGDGQTIIIEGVLGTDEDLKRVREMIAKVPVSFPTLDLLHLGIPDKRQIVCHVRVVDVNKGSLSRLGVNWGQLSIKDNTVAFVDQPWLISTLPAGLAAGVNGIKNALSLGAQLDALAQNNYAKILSEPNLMVDDGGKATILVGGEIPVPISQPGGGGGSVTIDWKSYGVKLEMSPVILEDGDRINLNIAPEVSSLDFGNAITLNGFVLPALSTRKASTVVTMTKGDTLVLGGMLQSNQTKAVRRIPLLGDLPIIGALFTRKEFQTGESELVIMVTPEIIMKASDKDATLFH